MKLHLASDEAGAQLPEQFVENHAECGGYRRWGWKQVIENRFDWPAHYQMLEEADSSRGILPLVWQRSRLSGFLTTSPFLNRSGVVAETKTTKHALTMSSGEPAALAKTRIQILHDQERQGRLAPGGIDWVREKFDVGGTAAKVLQLHSALCGIT